MNVLYFLLILHSIVITVTRSDEVRKCCAHNEILSLQEETYTCAPDISRRFQINANNTNFIQTNSTGICYDVFNNDFVTFNVDENKIDIQNEAYFPKCCPLNAVYDTKRHSCVENKNSTLNFMNQTFVKIGLTHCKIIADFPLEQSEDFEDKLFNNMNIIRRNSLHNLGSFCIDKDESDAFVTRECQEGLDSCDNLKCIKKCCQDGQSYLGSKCEDTYKYGLDLSYFSKAVPNYQEKFAIIHNRTCPSFYKISPIDNVTIHKNGSFSEWTEHETYTEPVGDMFSYCIEHMIKPTFSGYFIFHCFPEEDHSITKFEIRLWPFIISCVFLILTIVVYVIIKEWRKMFGKILVNYCLGSFFDFFILLLGQLNLRPTVTECQLKAFLLLFFAVAEFSWANVMSFEIWCTFGKTKLYLGASGKEKEFRKFICYSLYGWGLPLIVTLITYLFFEFKVLPYAIQPFLAETRCFFEPKPGNYAKVLFFNIPLLIIQLINMTFFYKTVTYCMKVRNEINKINDGSMKNKFHKDKESLYLIIKLSIVMGISYIFEVVTAFFNMSEMGTVSKYTEIVLDMVVSLQGVYIFIIFVCKKRILLAIAHKFTCFKVVKTPISPSVQTHSSLTLDGISMSSVGN